MKRNVVPGKWNYHNYLTYKILGEKLSGCQFGIGEKTSEILATKYSNLST